MNTFCNGQGPAWFMCFPFPQKKQERPAGRSVVIGQISCYLLNSLVKNQKIMWKNATIRPQMLLGCTWPQYGQVSLSLTAAVVAAG